MPTVFNLHLIARKSNHDEARVNALLQKLTTKGIIEYKSKNNDATLVFNEVREDEKTINRVSKYLENRNNLKISQLQSVLHYVNDKNTCKNRLILTYFGETKTGGCGICSYCITKKTKKGEPEDISGNIRALLETRDLSSRDIQKLTHYSADDVIFAVRQLLEGDIIAVKPNNQYTLKK